MLFNSYSFLLAFLPAAVIVFAMIDRRPRLRIPCLLLFSLLFYGYWNPSFVLLLAGSILVNWLAARWFAATRNNAVITMAIVLNLAVLGLFKYANFFTGSVAALVDTHIGRLDIVLPLGISFFTFHHIMYLVDLRRGRAEPTTLDRYALYISFFPQAVAGPLARWSEVGRQFGRDALEAGWEQRCALGITFIIIGLIEKVLLRRSDRTHPRSDLSGRRDSPVAGWIRLARSRLRIPDLLRLRRLFRYRDRRRRCCSASSLPYNFNAPFRATSILVFWQRWHMTLSRFLRDYVFMPLADMRIAGNAGIRWRSMSLAIMLTMALCGLWHGAGWNFVLWGTCKAPPSCSPSAGAALFPSCRDVAGWAATIAFFLLSCVMFRTAIAGGGLEHLFRPRHVAGWPDAEQSLDRGRRDAAGGRACRRRRN